MAFFPLNLRPEILLWGVFSLLMGSEIALAQNGPPVAAPPEDVPSESETVEPAAPDPGAEEDGATPDVEAPPGAAEGSKEQESTQPKTAPLVPRLGSDEAEERLEPSTDTPSPSDTPSPTEATVPAEEESASPRLKARLDSPRTTAPQERTHLPPPVLRPEAARPLHLQADRTEIMPGNFVARPVTLPKGTFKMEFGQTLVLWDIPPESALAPAFGLGITERLEIGVDAPLHHDPGSDAWAALHPRPHIAVKWTDEEKYEIGTRFRALVPARPAMEPSAAVAVPVLFRPSKEGRIDVVPELHVGVGSAEAIVARVNAKGTWQISPGMFAGLGATAHIGFVDSQDSGVDPEVTFGLTHQNYGRSFVDFVTHAFIKSLAGGEPGHFSRGAGFGLSLVFYPDLY